MPLSRRGGTTVTGNFDDNRWEDLLREHGETLAAVPRPQAKPWVRPCVVGGPAATGRGEVVMASAVCVKPPDRRACSIRPTIRRPARATEHRRKMLDQGRPPERGSGTGAVVTSRITPGAGWRCPSFSR